MDNILILDCTPSMADVVSEPRPKPHERQPRENAFQWLKQTPAWKRTLEHFGFTESDFWPGVKYQPELKPPANLGLDGFPHIYALAWHKPPVSRSVLLLVNEDGTRCAVVDLVEEVSRLWSNVRRPNAGRPRIESNNIKTLESRRLRDAKRKAQPG